MESVTFQQNSGKIIISGLFLPFSDQPNGNNRIYNSDSISDKVLEEFKKDIKERNALGENFIYHHDLDFVPSEILLTNVSHIINKVEKTEKGLIGEIELLATPQGNLVKELLDKDLVQQMPLCVRPRCSGSVNEDKTVTIERIFSFDLLSSYDDAFNPDSYRNRRYKLSRNKNNRYELSENKNIRYNLSENKEEA